MSCVADQATFRLLDAYVGWDADDHTHLTGLDSADGVRLQALAALGGTVSGDELLPYLPPARLAQGCDPCEWYLLAQTTVGPQSSTPIKRRDACQPQWRPLWRELCAPDRIVRGVAISARRHRIAVSDPAAERVWVWRREGESLMAAIPVAEPGVLTLTPWGELLVVDEAAKQLRRYSPSGEDRGPWSAPLPGNQIVDRMAVDEHCRLWLVTRVRPNLYRLWVAIRGAAEFRAATVEELAAAFTPTAVTAASEQGFCVTETGSDGLPHTHCFSWAGYPLGRDDIANLMAARLEGQGQLLTQAIDSGVPRCTWHRVRIEAEVPAACTLAVEVASSEDPNPPAQGEVDPAWLGFPAGVPHPADWQTGPAGSVDFLIDQPPGRYLFLRMRLTGDGVATPRVRRLRVDFPRITSVQYLPAVYREDPRAEDFTERFFSLFDASLEDLDAGIVRHPALLDADGVPEQTLPWLGRFLDIVFDSAWDTLRRRRILKAAPALYRRRGTLAGMEQAVELVFDAQPVIREWALERNWGAVGNATVGGVRLFGRSRARLRLGTSALSKAPIRSYGDPDTDPLSAQAYRFQVLMPPQQINSEYEQQRLIDLINNQKPAHTLASVRVGGSGLVLGVWSAVGVDTLLAAPPAPRLGEASARLNRTGIVRHGRRGARLALRVGQGAAIGINTRME